MKTKAFTEQQQSRRRPSKNLGFTDRQVRAIIGTLMLATPALGVTGTLGLWTIAMLASVPVLITAITGWDPVYAFTGKSTYDGQSENIQQRHWTNANIGIIERGIRLGMGLSMLAALMVAPAITGGMTLTLLAIPLIVTSITAWDPFYALMRSNSFASRVDVEAAEPGVNENTLAAYYELPQSKAKADHFAHAA